MRKYKALQNFAERKPKIFVLKFANILKNIYIITVCPVRISLHILFINVTYLQKLSTSIHTIICLILYNNYSYSIAWCPLTPTVNIKKQRISYM